MEVIFFNEHVKNDLYSFEKQTVAKSLKVIGLLETFGNTLGMPYSKKVADDLYELRVRGTQEIRMFYCYHVNQAVILHCFIKKSQKIPQKELETAAQRLSHLTMT